MKAFTTTRYRCDHCGRTLASKSRMRKHEAACHRDPAQRSCPTCGNHDFGCGGDECDEGIDNGTWPRGCEAWKAKVNA